MGERLVDKMVRARLFFLNKSPYLYSALLGLIPYETDKIPTCAVTKRMVLMYNPAYFEKLTHEQIAARLWHEVNHIQRETFDRLPHATDEARNICADLAINSDGIADGWDMSDGQLPAAYGLPERKSTEEYYDLLRNKQKKVECCWGGQCGSGGGNPVPGEDEANDAVGGGRPPEEVRAIQLQVASDIIKHAGQHPGTVSGGWLEWANALRAPPKIRWETALKRLVSTSLNIGSGQGGADISYRLPNWRDFVEAPGVMRPVEMEREMTPLIVLDTSGSMGQRELGRALVEIQAVLRVLNVTTCLFMHVDYAIAKTERVHVRKLAHMQIAGRGGTSFRPPFEALQRMVKKPDILIYLTDGYGDCPEHPPKGIPVIWVIIHSDVEMPWGKVVRVKADDK